MATIATYTNLPEDLHQALEQVQRDYHLPTRAAAIRAALAVGISVLKQRKPPGEYRWIPRDRGIQRYVP